MNVYTVEELQAGINERTLYINRQILFRYDDMEKNRWKEYIKIIKTGFFFYYTYTYYVQ